MFIEGFDIGMIDWEQEHKIDEKWEHDG